MPSASKSSQLTRIFRTWWPLAASWGLMALELPAISAVMARLAEPQIHLAAWGGIVFPVALIVEAPIIMLLAASTALSRDRQTFRRVRTYMMWTGGSLTALHILVAFTPLYDVLVVGLIHPPPEIVEAARLGLRLMTPWTWSIAYRRFNQGALIRFGHSDAVGVGTVIRLSADATVLAIGLALGRVPGVIVAGSAVSLGVISEAIYSGVRLGPVLRREMPERTGGSGLLNFRSFLGFYAPLAMTSLLLMLTLPLGSAAVSRMPRALESLATWPSLAGLVFFFRAIGMSYNEVVVARLEDPGAYPDLRRFTRILAVSVTAALALIAVTPLAGLWFRGISALPPELAGLGRAALWTALPVPALTVLQSWYQGALVHARRTRAVTEAIAINLAVLVILFPIAIRLVESPPTTPLGGLTVTWGAFALGNLAQTAWLRYRSRGVMAEARARTTAPVIAIATPEVIGG